MVAAGRIVRAPLYGLDGDDVLAGSFGNDLCIAGTGGSQAGCER